MNQLKGKFKLYDPSERLLVCPFQTENDYDNNWSTDQRIDLLAKLGLDVKGEISMPIDLNVRFILVQLPDWLELNDTEDELSSVRSNFYCFVDKKNRDRLVVSHNKTLSETWVRLRYTLTTKTTCTSNFSNQNKDGCVEDCVVVMDFEESTEDNPKIIWEDPKSFICSPWDDTDWSRGVEFLNKNYPLWRDPVAYFTP